MTRPSGWRPHLEWTGTYAELELPNDDWLGLYRRDGYAEEAGARLPEPVPDRQTGTELYVMVSDLDEAEERLHAAGAKALDRRARRTWGHEAAYFADPDGNVVAVAQVLD
jgi:catechol 2,3-dioxygenase-like lactoylglutathione lyase family enzyme